MSKMPTLLNKNSGICFLLLIAVLAVYWNVQGFDFIRYDDPQYVMENPVVQSGLTIPGIRWALTDISTGYWHPLTWISLMADYELYGMNAGGYHLTNLLLHIANAMLLFAVLNMMTGAVWRSAFVAALFALHPLHVESVAWVAERKDVLSGLFWILTMLAYVRYVRLPGWGRYLVVFMMFVLGIMAKPMMVTLPFVLLLMDYWPLGRYQRGCKEPLIRGGESKVSVGRLILEKIPLFIVVVFVSIGTIWSQKQTGAIMSSDALSLPVRIANALSSYVIYMGKMFWPVDLAVYYPHPGIWSTAAVIGSISLLLVISLTVVWLGRRYAYLPVGWLWYLGILFPVSGIVAQSGTQAMADRYTYLSLIGLFIIVAWGVDDLFARYARLKLIPPFLGAAVVGLLMVLSWMQVQYWQDSVRLLTHAVAVTKNNASTYYNLGNVYSMDGRIPEALESYRQALRINPDYPDVYNSLGVILFRQGKTEDAIGQYREALKRDPAYAKAYFNMGVARVAQGRIAEALACYDQALKVKPDFAEVHNNIGIIRAEQKRMPEAVVHFRAAVAINPWYRAAADNLRIALQAKKGK